MRSRGVVKTGLLEFVMLVAISMATLSALSNAFYVRFLFALRKEWGHHGIRYWCAYALTQRSRRLRTTAP